MNSVATGYPDGNPMPSVTIDSKTIYTLAPTISGSLVFALAPCAEGALYLFDGTLTAPVDTVILDPSAANGYSTTTLSAGTRTEGLLPGGPGSSLFSAPFRGAQHPYSQFRTIMAVAEVSYSGATMTDSGSAVISEIPMKAVERGTTNLTATSGNYTVDTLDTSGAGNWTLSTSFTNSTVIAARESCTLRVVAAQPTYQPISAYVGTEPINVPLRFANSAAVVSTTALCPNFDNAIPAKVISYTGLDQSSTITVVVRHCIQYALNANSSFVPLAASSPSATPSVLSRIRQFATSTPVVEFVGHAAAQAWNGIARPIISSRYPAIRPLLPLMNH